MKIAHRTSSSCIRVFNPRDRNPTSIRLSAYGELFSVGALYFLRRSLTSTHTARAPIRAARVNIHVPKQPSFSVQFRTPLQGARLVQDPSNHPHRAPAAKTMVTITEIASSDLDIPSILSVERKLKAKGRLPPFIENFELEADIYITNRIKCQWVLSKMWYNIFSHLCYDHKQLSIEKW